MERTGGLPWVSELPYSQNCAVSLLRLLSHSWVVRLFHWTCFTLCFPIYDFWFLYICAYTGILLITSSEVMVLGRFWGNTDGQPHCHGLTPAGNDAPCSQLLTSLLWDRENPKRKTDETLGLRYSLTGTAKSALASKGNQRCFQHKAEA